MSRWSQLYQIGLETRIDVREHLGEQYQRMESEGALETLHISGETFEYAVIPRNDIFPDPVIRQRWFNNYKYAFTTEAQDPGRISFVLEEVPAKYIDILAAHEYVENRYIDHDKATNVELEFARERGVLKSYLDWVGEAMPSHQDELQGLLQ